MNWKFENEGLILKEIQKRTKVVFQKGIVKNDSKNFGSFAL